MKIADNVVVLCCQTWESTFMDGVVIEGIDIGETNPFNNVPEVPASVDQSDIPPQP